VDGEVIGGMYLGRSAYYCVRLKHGIASPTDSVSGPLLRAERTLRALPYVRSVLYDRVDTLVQAMSSAPDSVPTALWDTVTATENILSDPPSVSGRVLRHLLYVQFLPAVTQSQRAAAIASIHGRVIGGVGFGGPENFYAILIPYQLAAGDSSSGPLLRAQAAMVNLSIVDQVMPAYMDEMVPKHGWPDVHHR
jgi:hypothetical protein